MPTATQRACGGGQLQARLDSWASALSTPPGNPAGQGSPNPEPTGASRPRFLQSHLQPSRFLGLFLTLGPEPTSRDTAHQTSGVVGALYRSETDAMAGRSSSEAQGPPHQAGASVVGTWWV